MIVGSWSTSSISQVISGHPNPEVNTTQSVSYGKTETLIYTFNEDKTGKAVRTLVELERDFTSEFTYSVSDTSLTFNWLSGADEGRTISYKLGTLDSKELSFSRSVSVDGTAGDERGNLNPYTMTTKTTYIMKKV